jgi:hypothetical protein
MLKYRIFYLGSNYGNTLYDAYYHDAIPEDKDFTSIENANAWLQGMNKQNKVDKQFNYVILPIVSL